MKCLILILSLASLAHAGEPDNRRSTYAGLIQLAQQPPRSAPIAAPTSDPFADPKPVKPVASAEKPSLPPVEPVKAMPKADGKWCDVFWLAGSGKFLAFDQSGRLIAGANKIQLVSEVTGPQPLGRITTTKEVLGVSRTNTADWKIKTMTTIEQPAFDQKIQQALEGE